MTAPSSTPKSEDECPTTERLRHRSMPIVQVESNETVRKELVQMITAWLVDQGFTSSAQLLREEANAQLRGEHYQRKALRGICQAIQERNWEAAQSSLKQLQSRVPPKSGGKVESPSQLVSLMRLLPFLLAQQQFLELVDEDDGQRAFIYLMRRIKPFEQSIGREHFQKLTYVVTCKTVAEAGMLYPEYRGWMPETGRTQLLQYIHSVLGSSVGNAYCYQGSMGSSAEATVNKSLELIVAEALSYRVIEQQHPNLCKAKSIMHVASLAASLDEQLAPTEPFLTVDVNMFVRDNLPGLWEEGSLTGTPHIHLTACQLFSSVAAVATSTDTGSVLWIPLGERKSTTELYPREEALLLYKHKYPVRGMCAHGTMLLCWGGCQTAILNLSRLLDTREDTSGAMNPSDCVANMFTYAAGVFSGCFFPCGTVVATGLSDGTVTLWDTVAGTKMYENCFTSSAIVSIVANRSGMSYLAGSKDGVVRVVDVATGVLTFSLASPISTELSSIAISPSSSLLLVSYRGGSVRLWDVLTGSLLPYRLSGIENNTRTSFPVSFGNTDYYIFGGSEDGSIYFWDLNGDCSVPRKDVAVKRNTNNQETSGTLPGTWPSGSFGAAYPNALPSRWPRAEIMRPSSQLPLHRTCVTDVKVEGAFTLSCSYDGMIALCTNPSKGAY